MNEDGDPQIPGEINQVSQEQSQKKQTEEIPGVQMNQGEKKGRQHDSPILSQPLCEDGLQKPSEGELLTESGHDAGSEKPEKIFWPGFRHKELQDGLLPELGPRPQLMHVSGDVRDHHEQGCQGEHQPEPKDRMGATRKAQKTAKGVSDDGQKRERYQKDERLAQKHGEVEPEYYGTDTTYDEVPHRQKHKHDHPIPYFRLLVLVFLVGCHRIMV